MKKILYLFTAILLLSATLLTGCGQNSTADNGQKADGKFRIVTSFYPVYIATANITKGVDGVEVINMTKPQTGCLHDYQLTTDDMKTLDQADAFVANGAGMEAFLDKVINEHKNLKVIDASKDIELLQDEEGENPHVWLSITDAKGTVVATIDADGGTALWNLTDNAGKRVPTGRYTIVATPANGSEGTTVGRIDVIR